MRCRLLVTRLCKETSAVADNACARASPDGPRLTPWLSSWLRASQERARPAEHRGLRPAAPTGAPVGLLWGSTEWENQPAGHRGLCSVHTWRPSLGSSVTLSARASASRESGRGQSSTCAGSARWAAPGPAQGGASNRACCGGVRVIRHVGSRVSLSLGNGR